LQPAFNILPSIWNERLHLLLEIGNSAISFIWFTKQPLSVKGICIYDFTKKTGQQEIAMELEKIIASADIYHQNIESSVISFDFPESLLVPGKYYEASSADQSLSLVFGDDPEAIVKTDVIERNEIRNCFRIQPELDSLLQEYYPGASYFHSTSLQMKGVSATMFRCTIFPSTIKVIFIRDGNLQIVQQFNYGTPADIAYHLLNTCRQFNIDVRNQTLTLNGMIEERSNLYSELYKYFMNIDLDTSAENIDLSQEIKDYPPHFFSNLIAMAICVS
jgi:hypothetical protein